MQNDDKNGRTGADQQPGKATGGVCGERENRLAKLLFAGKVEKDRLDN